MNKFIGTLLAAFLLSNIIIAQGTTDAPIEMADKLIANGKIYVVIGVLCIVFTCITTYLIILDRKISKLEKSKK